MSYCDAHNDFMCPHNDYVCTDRQWVCVYLQWLCNSQNCIMFFLKDSVIFTMALFTIIMTICNIHSDYVWPSQWVFVTSQWFTCFQNETVHPHNDSLWSLSYHTLTIKFDCDCDFDNDFVWLHNDSVWPHNDIVWLIMSSYALRMIMSDSQWLCNYHYISIWPWQWLCDLPNDCVLSQGLWVFSQ